MIVITFDISTKRTGWAVGDLEYEIEDSGSFESKSYVEAYTWFNTLCQKWKPALLATAKPTNHYNVIRALSEVTGVLLLCAERRNIKVDKTLVDSSCKKVVLGSGKATKLEIMNHYGINDQDEADACMMWDYMKIKHNE